MTNNTDAFAGGDKAAALSFKGSKPGTTYTGVVEEGAKLVQCRDYDSGQPDFWDAEKTQPKMAAVLRINVDGTPYSVWATKPSSLFSALATAQTAAKAGPMEPGGTVTITHESDEPSKKGSKFNARKIYSATYTPPTAAGSDDDAPF